MSAPEVRLTDDERETLRRALPGRVRPGEGVEAVEGIVAARLAAQAEHVAAAVERTLADHRMWFHSDQGDRWSYCACARTVRRVTCEGSTPEALTDFGTNARVEHAGHVAERVAAALRGDT